MLQIKPLQNSIPDRPATGESRNPALESTAVTENAALTIGR